MSTIGLVTVTPSPFPLPPCRRRRTSCRRPTGSASVRPRRAPVAVKPILRADAQTAWWLERAVPGVVQPDLRGQLPAPVGEPLRLLGGDQEQEAHRRRRRTSARTPRRRGCSPARCRRPAAAGRPAGPGAGRREQVDEHRGQGARHHQQRVELRHGPRRRGRSTSPRRRPRRRARSSIAAPRRGSAAARPARRRRRTGAAATAGGPRPAPPRPAAPAAGPSAAASR